MGYIAITGGELSNKGAQSMMFITVDEITKRFPDKKIIVFSSWDALNEENHNKFLFQICENKFRNVLYLCGGILGVFSVFLSPKKEKTEKLKKTLQETDFIIDISGFALSSNWSPERNIVYLSMILCAKRFGIPVYIFPQSFGPFNYKGFFSPIIHSMIKKAMVYPKVIFAREEEGYALLKKTYKLRNVLYSSDLVLLNKSINVNNIYRKCPDLKILSIPKQSVAIIPNIRSWERSDQDAFLSVYKAVIDKLITQNKNVFLLSHSLDDIKICKQLKDLFSFNENVTLLEEDFTCLEFNEVVKQFDFLIASRYHSIVHAYKNGIPCVVLGWAVKYKELLHLFHQNAYLFNILDISDNANVIEAVERMNNNYTQEAVTIKNILASLQKQNVFSVLQEEMGTKNG